jgi:hypothetical protein
MVVVWIEALQPVVATQSRCLTFFELFGHGWIPWLAFDDHGCPVRVGVFYRVHETTRVVIVDP